MKKYYRCIKNHTKSQRFIENEIYEGTNLDGEHLTFFDGTFSFNISFENGIKNFNKYFVEHTHKRRKKIIDEIIDA